MVRALVKPEVIQWVRKNAGLSIEEVARKTATRDVVVRRWEDGSGRPTIRQLRLLANAAKRPLAIFYLDEPPRKFSVLRDFRQFPGGSVENPSPPLRLAIRLAFERRQVALDLAEYLNQVPEPLSISAEIGESVINVSRRIRDFLGITPDEQRSWTNEYDALNSWRKAIQKHGVLVFQAPKVEVNEMRGFSLSETPMPVIVLNVKDAPNGRVFTLMHEFSHLLLRNSEIYDIQDWEGRLENNEIEVFCNAVAGETLVPTMMLRQSDVVKYHDTKLNWDDAQLKKLSREFSVSKEVVLRRLLDTNMITHSRYQDHVMAIHEEGRQNPAENQGGFVSPDSQAISQLGREFIRLVLVSCYQEKITTSDVSAYLGVRLKHLGKIEKQIMGSSQMFDWPPDSKGLPHLVH